MVMNPLNRRLKRMVQSNKGSFIALSAVVMLGVMVYISMTTAYYNLSGSQVDFYQKNRFADYYFQVVKAPATAANRLQSLPGVKKVDGRIQKDLSFIKSDGGRGTVRATGYQLPMENNLNQAQVASGRMFSTEGTVIEVLVDPQFAQANHLEQGGQLEVIAGGRKIPLQVVGTAISPEFIYVMKDSAALIPEPKEFGIVMMPATQLEKILNMTGQVNQFVLQLDPGIDADKLKNEGQQELAAFGNINAYPRDDQLSHAILKVEFEGLQVGSVFLSLMFFLIAAGIQFILLGRMIKSQRTSIGVMKAIGYGNLEIIGHYVSYAAAISLMGAFWGCLTGVGLAAGISSIMARYFNLPATIGGVNGQAIIQSIIISLVVGILSGLLACRSIIGIMPAEAMRTPAPKAGKAISMEKCIFLWARLSGSWRMSIRSVVRNRARFMVIAGGVVGSVILMFMALFFQDGIKYMMERHFQEETRYDYLIQFSTPLKVSEIDYWRQWPEIEKMEEVLDIPARVSLVAPGSPKARAEDDTIHGMAVTTELSRVFDREGRMLAVPEEGILLNQRTADKLGVAVGDAVEVETRLGLGPNHTARLLVVGLNQPLMGGGSYVSLSTANRLLQEQNLLTRLLVQSENGQDKNLRSRLEPMTAVSSVIDKAQDKTSWETVMKSKSFSIGIMIVFAAVLALAIIYNAALMNFNERRRELASLRVLGYTRREVGFLLFKENIMQAGLGILLGLPLGRWLSVQYMAALSTDFYSMPLVVYPSTYLTAALGTCGFVLIGYCLVLPRIKDIDLVESLKNID